MSYIIFLVLSAFTLYILGFLISRVTLHGLFIDDERKPEDVSWLDYDRLLSLKTFWLIRWTVVRTPEQFREAISKHNYDIYSFDHDLGTETTGYDLLKELVEKLIDFEEVKTPMVVVHSKNNVGADNIRFYWDNFCKRSRPQEA